MKKLYLFLSLLLPMTVYAKTGESSDITGIIMMEVIQTFLSIAYLIPLSRLVAKDENDKPFWKLFFIRLAVVIIIFFVRKELLYLEMMLFSFWPFLIPLWMYSKKRVNRQSSTIPPSVIISGSEVFHNCKKCGIELKAEDKVCPNCGETVDIVTADLKATTNTKRFDDIYNYSEDRMLEEFIKRELSKAAIDTKTKLIPQDILKRKKILNIIFSILVFVYISIIFFHFPNYTYIIGIIILIIFYTMTRKYDFIKYLKKEIKSRPSEKISNIIMNIKNSFVEDNSKIISFISLIIAVGLPLLIFMNPIIMYEKVDGGYAVRYYIFGLTDYTTATIPDKYKGEDVISLRGNAFSNMPFLEKVEIADTVTEIRGQAFKNDKNLLEVKLPKNLKTLGGGAFYNCTSLKSIELPDTLIELGGESFYNNSSLESVKLSNNLTEIRGDTFEYCTSLTSIDIPDSVTRIGGHAFYGDIMLQNVNFTPNSKLNEIGSSAFRQCSSLDNITIPKTTNVNSKAFKESPTTISYFK